MIEFDRLSHTYRTSSGEQTEALRGVSIKIPRHCFTAVVGASGCGKSTLLRLLAGLEMPTSGQIRVEGKPVTGPREEVGIAFQAPTLLPWADVLHNVVFPLRLMRKLKPHHSTEARHLLDLAGLAGFERKMPDELSGGMQQRVAICRALLHNPSILLLDEPFGALDALTREELSLELLRICGEHPKNVFMVTHSITEAILLSDKVVVMSPRPGRVVEVLDIDLSYPRTSELQETTEFQRYARHIRDLIFNRHSGIAKAAE